MGSQPIRFDDGDACQRFMGIWSDIVGQVFLDWLSPMPGQRWADIGCGNGAFTKSILRRCAPVKVDGIDPSDITGGRNRIFIIGTPPQRDLSNYRRISRIRARYQRRRECQPRPKVANRVGIL